MSETRFTASTRLIFHIIPHQVRRTNCWCQTSNVYSCCVAVRRMMLTLCCTHAWKDGSQCDSLGVLSIPQVCVLGKIYVLPYVGVYSRWSWWWWNCMFILSKVTIKCKSRRWQGPKQRRRNKGQVLNSAESKMLSQFFYSNNLFYSPCEMSL